MIYYDFLETYYIKLTYCLILLNVLHISFPKKVIFRFYACVFGGTIICRYLLGPGTTVSDNLDP